MEKAAESAQKHADEIIKVFIDGINDDSMKTRLAAANSWLSIEQEEAKLQLQEEKQEFDIGQASRDELIEFLANALTEGNIAEQLAAIDGTAEDVTDVEVAGLQPPQGDGDSG